jgi:hypothetical protein
MVHFYLVPNWFLGYDVGLEIVFALITLLVSIYAFRISKMSGQRSARLFATSFFFISMAYFLKAVFNFLIISRLNENISLALKIASVNTINLIALNFHVVLFSIGLITLIYMTFRVKSARVYSFLLITTLIFMFLAGSPIFAYHLLTSVFLIYIFIHYLLCYLNKKRINNLLMIVAFIFLLFGNIQFIFSISNNEIFYVVAHCLEFLAYLLVLVNLMLVRKNGEKKRQASDRS